MADGDRLEGRNGKIWRDYCAGATQEALAEEHSLAQSRISQIIAQVRDSIPEEEIEERKKRHLGVLDEMSRLMYDQALAQPAPAFSPKGDILRDEDGDVVRDTGARMAAVDRLGRLLERQAKLLGMDAASKVDLNMMAQQRAAEVAAEAASRMAQHEDGGDG